jgi:xanthine dehydrogenase YagT iron-sulfur-binding subunit
MTDSPSISRRQFLQGSGLAAGAVAAGAATLVSPPADAADPMRAQFQSRVDLRVRINGQERALQVDARVSLLDLLREQLQLTGTKKGCNEGACGVCTVLVDGERVNACLTLAASCEGAEVVTIEGLASSDGSLHPVQEAFIRQDAFQCGYCTPGQVMSAVACIREGHATDAATVREWMSGNICRCAAYPQIVAAVLDAAGANTGKGTAR